MDCPISIISFLFVSIRSTIYSITARYSSRNYFVILQIFFISKLTCHRRVILLKKLHTHSAYIEAKCQEIINRLPNMHVCVRESVCPSVHSSRFYIKLNISFIYKDIFTKFAGNIYGYENLSLQNFSLILKNKMAAIVNCLKIIQVL